MHRGRKPAGRGRSGVGLDVVSHSKLPSVVSTPSPPAPALAGVRLLVAKKRSFYCSGRQKAHRPASFFLVSRVASCENLLILLR